MALSTLQAESTSGTGPLLPSSTLLQCSDFTYTSQYCEENVYMLCKRLCSAGVADLQASDLFVIFISNENRQVPLWHQKASKQIDGLVIWDYHVICVQKCTEKDGQVQVWDLDSTLPFPVRLQEYITETVRPSLPLYPSFHSKNKQNKTCQLVLLLVLEVVSLLCQKKLFRVIHGPIFLRCFASDRRHMRNSEGNWLAPPPPYNCITAEDGTVHNLESFILMSEENINSKMEELVTDVFQLQTGVVIDESKLEEFFMQIL